MKLDHILIHPSYGNTIVEYAAYVQANRVTFEAHDNYQKQSYRNRMRIATSTGLLQLVIPILHKKDSHKRQSTFQVKIENSFLWQRNHWRSLKVAYQTSPFFEYYEDDFAPLYEQPWEKLIDFNLKLHQTILNCLSLELTPDFTQEYSKNPHEKKDLRFLAAAKKTVHITLPSYPQLFESNHGFLPHLSVLDLIFNEGPNAIEYLQRVDLSPL